MFQIGDKVAYGVHGICEIVSVEERRSNGKKMQYFVLEPQSQTGTRFYIPVNNPAVLAKLRQILSKEELIALLQSERIRQNCWQEDENARKQKYRELISSGDTGELLQMLYSIHLRKREYAAAGRKLHLCDEAFLKDAEKLIYGEISAILEISYQEVREYLSDITE